MNRLCLSLATLFTAGSIFTSSALAAKLDFTGYAGSYKATSIVVFGNTVLNGSNIQFDVAVPENGRQAKIKILGFGGAASNSGITYTSLLGNFTLTSQRRIVADNALLAFFVRLPATGRLSGSSKRLNFSLASSVSGVGDFSATYTLRFTGKKIIITGTGTALGGPLSVQYIAKKKHR
ncbi:MAG TPA: hypothetical protein VNB29_10250 [Chthoniobacterales bacterium]|jgi:hypothetical protein|nr:hypothetical protein [Chthoniobacterales bacterium]